MALEDVIWLAGFFDGEGSVSIFPANALRKRRRHQVTLTLTQKNKPVLDWVQSYWGGHVYPKSQSSDCYQLAIAAGQEAKAFLTAVVPYLRVKKARALEALTYLVDVYDPSKCRRGHTFTPETTILRANGRRRCLTCNVIDHKSAYDREPPEKREARRVYLVAYHQRVKEATREKRRAAKQAWRERRRAAGLKPT